jgi:hypothetical protein
MLFAAMLVDADHAALKHPKEPFKGLVWTRFLLYGGTRHIFAFQARLSDARYFVCHPVPMALSAPL